MRLLRLLVLLALLLPVLLAGRASAAPALSEAAGWLQQYLRLDTSNPPGNEQRGADLLAGILQREGIAATVVRNPEGRANLWARLSAPASGGRAILLLHHMDVVPPGPGWSVAPFAGTVRDGYLWGRGALDDKSLGIVQLAALVDLKRRRVPLARDVIFLAVADEENGGLRGTAWLLARHPELFRGVEGVIGEGGRSQTGAGGKVQWWGIEVAQKRPLWLEVSTSGRAGHGAGLNPDSANHQLIQGLARLLGAPPRWRVSGPVRDYCRAIAPLQNDHWRRVFANIDAVVTAGGPKEFLMPGMANLFLDTVQVTVLRGGDRINVIPGRAAARIDIRLLPDTDAKAFLPGSRTPAGRRLRRQGPGDLACRGTVARFRTRVQRHGAGPGGRGPGGAHVRRRLHRLALLPRAGHSCLWPVALQARPRGHPRDPWPERAHLSAGARRGVNRMHQILRSYVSAAP